MLGLSTLHESAPIASQILSESTFRVSETCKVLLPATRVPPAPLCATKVTLIDVIDVVR